MLGDNAVFSAKGKGYGKAAITPGGKPKPPFLAIEDDKKQPNPKGEKTDEQLMDEAFNKAKKMRDLAFSTIANYENAMDSVKGSKFWSKTAHKEALDGLQALQMAGDTLKKFISKPKMDIDLIKGMIMECGLAVKTATSSIKNMNNLANKAGSIAPSMKLKGKK